MALPIACLTYEDIRLKANGILKLYNAANSIPVPIEEIVEFDFDLNIIPINDLRTAYDIDAFTSKDMKTIMVDHTVMQSRSPNRYRFSLAHELGHIVLHRATFEEIQFSSAREWKKAVEDMEESDRSWVEWQAYAFAGLVLVPAERLKKELIAAVGLTEKQGLDLHTCMDVAKAHISTSLGRIFEVSSIVIEKRLDKDKLWPPKKK